MMASAADLERAVGQKLFPPGAQLSPLWMRACKQLHAPKLDWCLLDLVYVMAILAVLVSEL